jgi:hypothetical protein
VQRVAVDDVRVMKELKAKGIERIHWDDAEMRKVRELAHKTWKTGRRRDLSPSAPSTRSSPGSRTSV